MPTESNADKIAKAQSSLPLPEQPPVASDWQSADARTVNVGACGAQSGDVAKDGEGSTTGLREPATKKSSETADLSKIGREGKESLDSPPKDAAKTK